MLRLETRSTTDAVILEATGELRLGECEHLLARANELLEQGQRVVMLDLSSIDDVDAAGVGALLDTKRRIEEAGGRLILLRLTDRVHRLLDVCALTDVFEVQSASLSPETFDLGAIAEARRPRDTPPSAAAQVDVALVSRASNRW